jgi:hypothetical protein
MKFSGRTQTFTAAPKCTENASVSRASQLPTALAARQDLVLLYMFLRFFFLFFSYFSLVVAIRWVSVATSLLPVLMCIVISLGGAMYVIHHASEHRRVHASLPDAEPTADDHDFYVLYAAVGVAVLIGILAIAVFIALVGGPINFAGHEKLNRRPDFQSFAEAIAWVVFCLVTFRFLFRFDRLLWTRAGRCHMRLQ